MSLEKIKLSPSQKMVFSFSKDTLLKHNALIMHKASSLSSRERAMVSDRVKYGVEKGTITMEEVVKEVNDLTEFVKEQLTKELDDSITE